MGFLLIVSFRRGSFLRLTLSATATTPLGARPGSSGCSLRLISRLLNLELPSNIPAIWLVLCFNILLNEVIIDLRIKNLVYNTAPKGVVVGVTVRFRRASFRNSN